MELAADEPVPSDLMGMERPSAVVLTAGHTAASGSQEDYKHSSFSSTRQALTPNSGENQLVHRSLCSCQRASNKTTMSPCTPYSTFRSQNAGTSMA